MLLLAPQAGLVIVPMMLPDTSTREKPTHTIVVVVGVTRIPGLLLTVMMWKAPLEAIVPLAAPAVLQLPLIPRNSAVHPVKSRVILPVVVLPESKLPVTLVVVHLIVGSVLVVNVPAGACPVKLVIPLT